MPVAVQWETGYSYFAEQLPQSWYPAQIPGAVQLDVAKGENYPPFYYDNTFEQFAWMEDVHWYYQTVFHKPEIPEGERLYFMAKGIDYAFEVLMNGEVIYSQEGMFTPVCLDLTDALRDLNQLKIHIFPVPKKHPEPRDRTQASHCVKPAVSYGWDWHPRLIPLGIWDEAGLCLLPEKHLEGIDCPYTLSPDLDHATCTLSVKGRKLAACKLYVSLTSPVGQEVVQIETLCPGDALALPFSVANPMLWWPQGHGEPNLYTLALLLETPDGRHLQTHQQKIGFRKVRLVMNEGTWPLHIFPKSRSYPPITLEINHRVIFCKGTNWVNPEVFVGTITEARYSELLNLAKEAHFNLLRCWGGAIVNKEAFFNLCDALGLMVWQEFPLACNLYEDDPHYLHVLAQEAISIIEKVKSHPCLAIWCGGNELFNDWSGMTDQSKALRLLNSLCLSHDPDTPFLMTSPLEGMGHGHYVFKDPNTGEEVYQLMDRSHNTAYTEFGMPSPSQVEVLASFIPPEALFPPQAGTAWETHHAFSAWQGNTWLMPEMLEAYFGEAPDLETLVARGQWLQAEGYKCIYESARRQKPYCSMALNWCFNDAWPTAANNNLVSWPAKPKPAYQAVADSCRPSLYSARFSKFVWEEGEILSFDLWILNDAYQTFPPGELKVSIRLNSVTHIMTWAYPTVLPNQNIPGPMARFILPFAQTQALTVLLTGTEALWESSYTLLYRPKTTHAGKEKMLNI
jgi:beta-mannosidase